jgi:F0F1-type ATP synthase delta subunit
MKQSRTKIADYISTTTLKQGSSKKFVRQIAAYLLSEQRVDEVDSIMRDVQRNWAKAGLVEVIATSAHPLSAKALAEIKHKVKLAFSHAHQIIISGVVDPSIKGGVRLQLADQELDLSLAAKMLKFRSLTGNGKGA